MHENWDLGVVSASMLLPHSEVVWRLGEACCLEGQAWRMVPPQEDGVGEGGWEVGLKITGGGWQPWVCDSYLGTCVATDSVQVSQV